MAYAAIDHWGFWCYIGWSPSTPPGVVTTHGAIEMKVSELIAQLQQYPPDAVVVVDVSRPEHLNDFEGDRVVRESDDVWYDAGEESVAIGRWPAAGIVFINGADYDEPTQGFPNVPEMHRRAQ